MINKSNLISHYIIFALVTAGFIGILVFEGIVDEDGVEAAIIVDQSGGGDHTTIAAAITAASNGDTIYVWAGTYSENFGILKSITLIGNSSSNTTIKTTNSNVAVNIIANYVNVSGFNITGGQNGILLNTVSNCTVSDNIFYDNNYGILASASPNNKIHRNEFVDNGFGIYLNKANSNHIAENNFSSDTTYLIYANQCNSNVITNNNFKSEGYKIYMSQGNSLKIINNNFTGHNPGIYMTASTSNTIYANKFISNGIAIWDSNLNVWNSHTISTNNTVNNKPLIYWKDKTGGTVPAGAGQIILANCKQVKIENQNCSNTSYGITIAHSNDITIIKNELSFNHFGCAIVESNSIAVSDNFISNCSSYGCIIVMNSHDNVLKNNTANSNIDGGLALLYSNGNEVINNTCIGNGKTTGVTSGIYSTGSNNTIKNNNCTNNVLSGISLTGEDSLLENNTCNSNHVGIYSLNNGRRITVNNNTCIDNRYDGIRLNINLECYASNNTCSNNENGIQLWGGLNNNVENNTFDNNKKIGVCLNVSKYNQIKFNDINLNNQGLSIYGSNWGSHWNYISDNTISNSVKTGIFIDMNSTNNYLYYNDIIANPTQAVDLGINYWNNSFFEGNYWSDYAGVDNDADGIGDTAIPHLGLDMYPFTQQSGWKSMETPVLTGPTDTVFDGNYTMLWSTNSVVSTFILEEDSNTGFTSPQTVYNGPGLNHQFINKLDGTYYYRVKSLRDIYESEWSNVVEVIADSAPGVPTGLAATNITGLSANITWNFNPEPDIQGYRILTAGSETGPFNQAGTVLDNINQYMMTGLVEETTYYAVIVAFDQNSNSTYSTVLNFTTIDVTAPDAPIGLLAKSYNDHEIELTWQNNLEQDIAGYLVYINDTGNSADGNYHLLFTSMGADTNYTVKGLTEQTTYHYKLKAFDEVPNNSSFSDAASATTLKKTIPSDPEPPSPPSGLSIIDTSFNYITVSWTPNTELDVIGYFIYRCLGIEGTYANLTTKPFEGTVYNDTGLDELTTYYYKLKAVDSLNITSAFSEVVSATTFSKQYPGIYPPIIGTAVKDFSIDEDSYDDTTIKLNMWFIDPDGGKLNFSVTGQKNIQVTIYQDNGTVVLAPAGNWNGQETLIFYAEKKGIFNISDDVVVTVTAVKDQPYDVTITSPADGFEIKEGEELTLAGTAKDPDLDYGDVLSYQWTTGESQVLGSGETLTGVELQTGSHIIILIVTDKNELTSQASITIEVIEKDSDPGKTDDDKEAGFLDPMILAVLIIVIVIIVFLFVFLVLKKKPRKEEGQFAEPGAGEIIEPQAPVPPAVPIMQEQQAMEQPLLPGTVDVPPQYTKPVQPGMEHLPRYDPATGMIVSESE